MEEAEVFLDYLHERIEPEEGGLGLILDAACMECRNNCSLRSEEWKRAPAQG